MRIGEATRGGDEETPALELDDVHAGDLFAAFERIMAAIDPTRIGEHAVEYDDTPISLHQEDLLDRIVACARLPVVVAGRVRRREAAAR